MARRGTRKELFFDKDEIGLLRFAQKCYGLDMTATIKLLIRAGMIDLIVKWRQTRVPKLPGELVEKAENF